MSARASGFERLSQIDPESPRRADARRALFTTREQVVPLGALWLTCSSCSRRTPVTFAKAVRAAMPSVHVPWRRYPSWMRCPACRRMSWVKVSTRALADG